MKPDWSDVLIVLGVVVLVAGLYLTAWPLVLVALGGSMMWTGIRRA